MDQARNVERDVDRSLDLAFSRAHISGLGDRMSLAKLLTISPINRPKTMLLCDMPASRGADTNASFRKEVQGNERAEIPNVRISAGVSQPDVLKTCSSSRITSLSFRLPHSIAAWSRAENHARAERLNLHPRPGKLAGKHIGEGVYEAPLEKEADGVRQRCAGSRLVDRGIYRNDRDLRRKVPSPRTFRFSMSTLLALPSGPTIKVIPLAPTAFSPSV